MTKHEGKAEGEGVQRMTEHGYNVVYYEGVPYPPFIQPPAIDALRASSWLRESDIVIATFPKCGTTWMQNIVLCLLAGGGATVRDPMKMSKWVENCCSFKPENAPAHAGDGGKFTLDQWLSWHQPAEEQAAQPTRRVIKTHAPAHLVPWAGGGAPAGITQHQDQSPGARVIVVSRNPKDTAVSLFHHARDVDVFDYHGDWAHFLEHLFLPGKVEHGDFWHWHAGWRRAHQAAPGSIMWISYEEMKADLPSAVARVSEFCQIQVGEADVASTVAASSFAAMKQVAEEEDAAKLARGEWVKKNHIRAGVAGGWRQHFSDEQLAAFDLHHAARCEELGLPQDLFVF